MNETIINGIDVSEWELKGVLIPITECKYFEGIGDCKESKGLCVDNDNCYFKQLARLQEENEKLKEENEQLKKPCLVMPKVNQLAVPIDRYKKLYKALEEIRKEANRLLYEENPIYGYNNSNYFELLVKYVLAKTKEVLEDS